MYKTELSNINSPLNNSQNLVKKMDRKYQSVSKASGYPLGKNQNN